MLWRRHLFAGSFSSLSLEKVRRFFLIPLAVSFCRFLLLGVAWLSCDAAKKEYVYANAMKNR